VAVTVVEISCSGLSLNDDDRIADVIPDQVLPTAPFNQMLRPRRPLTLPRARALNP
jgi:hypothetical protein